jgi:hypothetical protein
LLERLTSIQTKFVHPYGSAPCQIYLKKRLKNPVKQTPLEAAERKTGYSLPLTWRCFLTGIQRLEVTAIPCFWQDPNEWHCGCSFDPWPTELEIKDLGYRFALTPSHVAGMVSQIAIREGFEDELLVSKFEGVNETIEITFSTNSPKFQTRNRKEGQPSEYKPILDSNILPITSFLDLISSEMFWDTMHLDVRIVDFILQARKTAEGKWKTRLTEKKKRVRPQKEKKKIPNNIFCLLEGES